MGLQVEVFNGTTVVSEVALLEYLFGEGQWYAVPERDRFKAVMGWLQENKAFFYARPNEDFSLIEALRLTRHAGHSIVVTDNLS